MDEEYPIFFTDAIHYSVRDNGVIRKLVVYVILGITTEGKKEVHTIQVGNNKSSKYWLSVLNEMKNRGIKDIQILCADGLTGLKEAFATDLKTIYQPPDEKKIQVTFERVTEKWTPKHPNSMKHWKANWNAIFRYSNFQWLCVRSYIQNVMESLNSTTYRRLNQQKSVYPSDKVLLKTLYLASTEAAERWTTTIQNWGQVCGELSIMYEGRLPG